MDCEEVHPIMKMPIEFSYGLIVGLSFVGLLSNVDRKFCYFMPMLLLADLICLKLWACL